MNKNQKQVLGLMLGLGLILSLLILLTPRRSTNLQGTESIDNPEYEQGSHGGRLLTNENGDQLEATIFEAGVPPEFRFYPIRDGNPIDPSRFDVFATVHRLGGIVDTVLFAPHNTFLRGDTEAYEPHSFEVVIEGTLDGSQVKWSYSTIEGRVIMPTDMARINGVEESTADQQVIRSIMELPGEIHLDADRVAKIAPRISGSVVDVLARLGDQISAGDVLAVIESRELGLAKRDYIESLHRLEFSQATYSRERSLHDQGISARKDYEKARHELEEAELERQMSEQVLLALGIRSEQLSDLGVEPEGVAEQREVRAPLPESLTRFYIRSPIRGEVIERNLSVGQTVVGNEAAFTVADLSTVWVDVTVYPRDLDKIEKGQNVTIRTRDGSTAIGHGVIEYLGPQLGEITRTSKARLTLENDGRWKPGMFVLAEIEVASKNVQVAVKREAVQSWRDMPVIFARFGEYFEVRPIVLGSQDETHVEVIKGLRSGQPYAEVGAYLLKAELEKSGATHDH